MLLAITAAALAEGVGIAALLPLIGLVIGAEGAGGTMTQYVEQVFAVAGLKLSLGGLLALTVVAISLKSLLMLLAMAQVGYAAAHVAMDLRLSFIRALLKAALGAFRGSTRRRFGKRRQRRARAYRQRLSGLLPRPLQRDSAPDLPGVVRRDFVGGLACRRLRRRIRHGRVEPARRPKSPRGTEPDRAPEILPDARPCKDWTA